MNKKTIDQFTTVLKQVLEIMGDEMEFGELRKSERKAIYKIFGDSGIPVDYDNGCEGASATFGVSNDLYAEFFSQYVESIFDIKNDPHSFSVYMTLEGNVEIEGVREVLKALERELPDDLPLALLNTSILTTSGTYQLDDITLDQARETIANSYKVDSAIGHQSTAEIMTTLLDTEVAVNRQMFVQQVGQKALVFKLNGRPQEGKILTIDEINEIGYKFQLLTRIS